MDIFGTEDSGNPVSIVRQSKPELKYRACQWRQGAFSLAIFFAILVSVIVVTAPSAKADDASDLTWSVSSGFRFNIPDLARHTEQRTGQNADSLGIPVPGSSFREETLYPTDYLIWTAGFEAGWRKNDRKHRQVRIELSRSVKEPVSDGEKDTWSHYPNGFSGHQYHKVFGFNSNRFWEIGGGFRQLLVGDPTLRIYLNLGLSYSSMALTEGEGVGWDIHGIHTGDTSLHSDATWTGGVMEFYRSTWSPTIGVAFEYLPIKSLSVDLLISYQRVFASDSTDWNDGQWTDISDQRGNGLQTTLMAKKSWDLDIVQKFFVRGGFDLLVTETTGTSFNGYSTDEPDTQWDESWRYEDEVTSDLLQFGLRLEFGLEFMH